MSIRNHDQVAFSRNFGKGFANHKIPDPLAVGLSDVQMAISPGAGQRKEQ